MSPLTVTLAGSLVEEWSAGRFDVISDAELRDLGVAPTQVRSWLRGGRLHRLHPGVYAVGRPGVPPQGRWRAAVLGCGPVTALSHHSAGQADGLAVPDPEVVHITTTTRVRSGNGRIVHRARVLHPADLTTRHAIQTTSLERTLVDLADVLTYLELRRVFDKLRRLDRARLDAARARAGRRSGGPKLNHLLERDEPHTRSELERRFLKFVAAWGLPRPDRINARRHGYEIDCAYDAERVAVELDGRAFHTRGEQVREDHRRDADLHVAGWISHRLVWEDLNPFEAPATAARLQAVLETRRPR